MAPAAGNAGIIPCTTTAVTNTVGLSCDSGTYTTTQSSSGTAVFVSCIVNPHLVIEYRMSGGATAGTSLANQDETTGSAGGTVVTTGAEWSSPTLDEGVVWANQGGVNANMGQYRKVTSVSSTAGTVTVPLDKAIAIGDDFLRAPYWILDPTAKTIQFTSNLDEANAAIAVGTGAAMVTVGFRSHVLVRPCSALHVGLNRFGPQPVVELFDHVERLLNRSLRGGQGICLCAHK